MGLRHAVVTSVDRDDLPDFGAGLFAGTIRAIRAASPGTTVEVLTPDFNGSEASLRAVMENWHSVPELTELWLGVVNRFASGLAVDIERERDAGLAKSGIDSRQLGSALIWATERCFHVAGLGLDKDLPGEQDIVEPLLAMWLGTIYGVPDGKGAKTDGSKAAGGQRPKKRP